jgi:hypothetical protein
MLFVNLLSSLRMVTKWNRRTDDTELFKAQHAFLRIDTEIPSLVILDTHGP